MTHVHLELSDNQIVFLRDLAESEHLSVAAVIRTAILLLQAEVPKL